MRFGLTNPHFTKPLTTIKMFGITISALMLLPLANATVWGCQQQGRQPPTPQQQQYQQKQTGQENQIRSGDRTELPGDISSQDDGEAPALGVYVSPSPGQGVFVAGTIGGSPAAEAGIQQGDYIMSVNKQAISNPRELKSCIEKLAANEPAEVTVWRNGEEFTRKINVAQKTEQIPDSHRTWLGVVMTPYDRGDIKGVRVEQLYPNGPAEKSGLRKGDVIIQADGRKTTRVDDLLVCFESHGPNTGCNLMINRDGQEIPVQVSFGDISEATQDWLQAAFRDPLDGLDLEMDWPVEIDIEGDDVREAIGELRAELNELRREMNSLKSGDARGSSSGSPEPSQRSSSGEPDQEESPLPGAGLAAFSHSMFIPAAFIPAAFIPAAFIPAAFLTAPAQQQGHSYGHRRYSNNWYGNSHYGNYGYQNNRNQYNRYGNNYNNYRQGQNRTWYYPYGGQQYYNRGNYNYGGNSYGSRFGIRIGNSWGAYWY